MAKKKGKRTGQSPLTLKWVAHVKRVRAKYGGGRKCTYSQAMRLASATWRG